MASESGRPRRRLALTGTGSRAEMFVRAITTDHAADTELVALADVNQARMDAHNRWLRLAGHDPVPTYPAADLALMLDRERVDELIGAPWWFLDSANGMRRFREAVTDTAGFYNTAGFVDDTRAFCSIPVRHDIARRIDAAYLASLVVQDRLPLDEAAETMADVAYHLPKQIFRLDAEAAAR
jgi:glucuronate isomerase